MESQMSSIDLTRIEAVNHDPRFSLGDATLMMDGLEGHLSEIEGFIGFQANGHLKAGYRVTKVLNNPSHLVWLSLNRLGNGNAETGVSITAIILSQNQTGNTTYPADETAHAVLCEAYRSYLKKLPGSYDRFIVESY